MNVVSGGSRQTPIALDAPATRQDEATANARDRWPYRSRSMSTTDLAADDLAEALEAAAPHIVVPGADEPIDIDTYRAKLHKVRSVHDARDAQFVSLFRPHVSDEDKRSRVKVAMRSLLTGLVEDDTVLCAQLTWDQPHMRTVSLDRLLAKLLELTLVHGAHDAARRFVDAVRSDEFRFSRLVLIEGIRVQGVGELAPGIRLFGLPQQFYELPGILPVTAGIWVHPGSFIGKAALSIDSTVTPRFLNPSIAGSGSVYGGDELTMEHPVLEDGPIDLDDLQHSLALSFISRVYRSVMWCHIDPDDPCSSGQSGPLVHWAEEYGRNPPQMTEADAIEVVGIYERIRRFEPDQVNTLRISIDRWSRSLREARLEDRLIDLATAFESLYCNDGRGAIGYQLQLRVARHLGTDVGNRKAYSRDIGKFYSARSKAVHKGTLKLKPGQQTEAMQKLVARVQDWYREGVGLVISDGCIPVWKELELQ